MYFYFDRSIIFEKKTPIYWGKIKDFLLKQSTLKDARYYQIKAGDSEKTCLLYGHVDEKKFLPCDFYLSLFDALQVDKKDWQWASDFLDEPLGKPKAIAFLPCVKSIKRSDDCNLVIFLVDKDMPPSTKIMVDYLSSLFKCTQKYLSTDIERSELSSIERDVIHCKKFISFSKNRILNQYFSVLLGNNFILCIDDQASPLRYAYVNMRHPSLADKEQNLLDKNCEFKYSLVTSNLRNLVVEIEKNREDVEAEITPEMIFENVERQFLRTKICSEKNDMHYFASRGLALPFALSGWAHHKKSLSELVYFVENHKNEEDMKKLLLSYLLVYMPIDYWKTIEQYYADDPSFCAEFKKNIDAISENSYKDYVFKWACGTYIRALKDNNSYACSWNDKSLATCLDLALNHKETEIIEKIRQLYDLGKYKDSLGLSLVEIFVDNALILKKEMRPELLNVCHQLLDLDENYGYGNYGARIFYKTILLWLENKFNDIVESFNPPLDGVKARGFLAKTALFLLKQKRFDFKTIAVKLLALEYNVLLAKNPEMLQLKILAYLEIGDHKNADICLQYLKQDKTYFKNFSSCFDKWYVQSCIEHKLRHFARENRCKFIHEALGVPCLWRMFE